MNTKIVSSIKINLIIFLVSTLMVSAGNLFAADDVVHWWVGDDLSDAMTQSYIAGTLGCRRKEDFRAR